MEKIAIIGFGNVAMEVVLKVMKTQRILTIALLEAAFVCYSSIAAAQTQNTITAGDWPSVNHDANGSRYSTLKEIDSTNVGALKKVGTYSFPDQEPSQTAYSDAFRTAIRF